MILCQDFVENFSFDQFIRDFEIQKTFGIKLKRDLIAEKCHFQFSIISCVILKGFYTNNK